MGLKLNNNEGGNKEIDGITIEKFSKDYPDLFTVINFDGRVITYSYYGVEEELIGILLNKKIYFYDTVSLSGLRDFNNEARGLLYDTVMMVDNILLNLKK